MNRRIWFDRRFELGIPAAALPDLIERLRGTPPRLAERSALASPAQLTQRFDGGWSIQEHVGHILDLEALWLGRVDDLEAGAEILRAADLENRATWEAHHNDRSLDTLLDAFRSARDDLVRRVSSMARTSPERTALHPRLMQPMSLADLCFFVAEHDDHHLAAITERLS